MDVNATISALSSITDQGLFERLAMTILRVADPLYQSLVHTGVNAEGKTIAEPLDGICFVPGANPPQLIAVHHTTSARRNLNTKWLHDPDVVATRPKSKRSSEQPGDVVKTARIVSEERKRVPQLRATLVLTTNREPSAALIRDVKAAGHAHCIEVDLWSCSRLAHFLDFSPSGHWIRRSFLQIEAELLSSKLLHELSVTSMEANHPPDDANAWIPRTIDERLARNLHQNVTFVVAGTGQGKSVACYRKLHSHVNAGGFGLFLSADILSSAETIDQAIDRTLRRLHPSLASDLTSALSFTSTERPLLLVVEDVNRATQTQLLVEKIVRWSYATEGAKRWCLLCPLWPEKLALISEPVRKRIETLILFTGRFSESEGRDAVIARARVVGTEISPLSALTISRALGHDPLLIALFDFDNVPNPSEVIGHFVNNSLSRIAAKAQNYPAAEYQKTLRNLAECMLAHRCIDPRWQDAVDWLSAMETHLQLISRIAHDGELIHFVGAPSNQWIVFRHDRVREWLLADAATQLELNNALPADIVAEPYYAELMGAVLVTTSGEPGFLSRVSKLNPLALFHALRLLRNWTKSSCDDILEAINRWLELPTTHNRSNLHLRLEALATLAETDSDQVPAIASKFSDRCSSGQLARLRNGDAGGGIELCITLGPGISYPWRDIQIEHAKLRHGAELARVVGIFLQRNDLNSTVRKGALRLAGLIGDPVLASAIEVCWNLDDEKSRYLSEYLWAFGQCCGNEPGRFLEPVCDAWAALPDERDSENGTSPRARVGAYELRFAFRRWPPDSAIDYFVERAAYDDLNWPITSMLHNIDHPRAVLFVVQKLAADRRRYQNRDPFFHFAHSVAQEWKRAQEDGRPMSEESRELLRRLWLDDRNDDCLRIEAFSLWEATRTDDDLNKLREASVRGLLGDRILGARLVRGDRHAIPDMIQKLSTNYSEYWWQFGRNVWGPELTHELESFFVNRGKHAKRIWLESCSGDSITSELIMRLPRREAEIILLSHWDHLRFSRDFIHAALYVATESLLEVVDVAFGECPEPAELTLHIGLGLGIKVKDHPGIVEEYQVLALERYLDLLDELDISMLWDECNSHGWFDTRKELLDSRLRTSSLQRIWSGENAKKQLDQTVDQGQQVWIGHWIDRNTKAGVPWTEILAVLIEWLEARRSLDALEVAAAAIVYSGRRGDLSLLKEHMQFLESETHELFLDTEFAVKRRTIN